MSLCAVALPAIVLAAATFAAGQQAAQERSDARQPTFRVSVDRVETSAVVTDSKGRHVTDLGIGDFTVLDEGKPQQLTHCEYVRLANPSPAIPANHARQYGLPPPPAAARELTREQVERTMVFLVDDESFAPEALPVVRGAVRSIAEQGLQPGDLVALIRTSSGNGSLEQFTSDRHVLLESCERIRWRPESRGNPGMLPQVSGKVVGEESSGYVVQLSISRTVEVLRYVISALADLPGRKAIFLISQSFPYGTNYATTRSGISAATPVGEMVDRALRAGVVIYSVDPTVLSSLTPGGDYDLTRELTIQNGAGASVAGRPAAMLLNGYTTRALALLEFARSGLRALSEGTGGLMGADTDAAAGLGRFVDDLQGYYLLTYKPQNPERYFAVKKGQPPPFHSVRIRVRRSGGHVRSYAGYIATANSAEPDTSAHGEISKALFSPFAASGIRVGLTSVFTEPKPESPELSLLLHIDARDLRFTPASDGRRHAGFELVARAADETDEPAQVVTKEAALRLEESSFREAMQMGLVYRVSVPAQRAGLYEVRVAIRDVASGKLGSAREYVEVPDLKNGHPAVSGVLVYSAGPRERDAGAPGLAEMRLFRREDSLGFACQIFNAKSVRAEARIVRDGKQVMAAPIEALGTADGTSSARGVIPLAALAPGNYVLQIVARGEQGKEVTASQWTDFEIVP
jgi:VWFA-related protein